MNRNFDRSTMYGSLVVMGLRPQMERNRHEYAAAALACFGAEEQDTASERAPGLSRSPHARQVLSPARPVPSDTKPA